MLRLANESDINDIYRLGNIINENFQDLYNIQELLNSKYDRLFIYENENHILGFIHIVELDDVVDVINIVVDVNNRSKGIASLLMDFMLKNVNSTIKKFTLEVSINNEHAIKLYQKYGFIVVGIRKKYYQGIDAYLMIKEV